MVLKATRLARPLHHSLRLSTAQPRASLQHIRCASSEIKGLDPAITDPNMNGGYVNPPRMKRALRDPYAGWWDQQERRNFGEPVHEDNDILTVFSPDPYGHASRGKAALHFGLLVATIVGASAVVYQIYPDRVSIPREYPGDLEAELGGPGTLTAKREPLIKEAEAEA